MPEEFVPGHLSALPIAPAIAALPSGLRHALVKDMAAALKPDVRDNHFGNTCRRQCRQWDRL